jgi:hypothetical protein
MWPMAVVQVDNATPAICGTRGSVVLWQGAASLRTGPPLTSAGTPNKSEPEIRELAGERLPLLAIDQLWSWNTWARGFIQDDEYLKKAAPFEKLTKSVELHLMGSDSSSVQHSVRNVDHG